MQGGLGGARVLFDARSLAMLHGCVATAFFAYCVALAVFTSRKWKPLGQVANASVARFRRIALLTVVFSYLQLIIGAQIRHISVMASPSVFRAVVLFHLVMAVVVTFHAFQLLLAAKQHYAAIAPLGRPAMWLAALVLLQVALGGATWVAKYGWPDMFANYSFAAPHVIHANSWLQATIVTLHVATGSLIVAFSVTVLARSIRLLPAPTVALGSGALMMELAG
jgi:cytochrome c oxidase assembly protein subunit 15